MMGLAILFSRLFIPYVASQKHIWGIEIEGSDTPAYFAREENSYSYSPSSAAKSASIHALDDLVKL